MVVLPLASGACAPRNIVDFVTFGKAGKIMPGRMEDRG